MPYALAQRVWSWGALQAEKVNAPRRRLPNIHTNHTLNHGCVRHHHREGEKPSRICGARRGGKGVVPISQLTRHAHAHHTKCALIPPRHRSKPQSARPPLAGTGCSPPQPAARTWPPSSHGALLTQLRQKRWPRTVPPPTLPPCSDL